MNRFFETIALFAVFTAGSANAGSSTGLVTALKVHTGDVVMFAAGSIGQRAACGVAGDEWAISLNTPTGKAIYALLLSANAQGKQVLVTGSNACNAWSDRETPYWVQLQ